MVTLAEKLAARRAEFKEKAPKDAQAVMQESARRLKESGILDHAKKEGDRAPDFALKNIFGNTVDVGELCKERRVVLCFYRGGW